MVAKARILKELVERAKGGDGLAMDSVSRMARAREQGFDIDNVRYHGTDAGSIEAFENVKNRAGQGKPVYMAPTPALANRFADAGEIDGGEVVYPLMTNVKNTFDFRNPEHLNAIKHYVSAEKMRQIKNGEWKAIEDSETIEAIKGFGFDSFHVMEGSMDKAFAEADRAKSRIFPSTPEGKKEGRDFYKGKVAEWEARGGKQSLKPSIDASGDGFSVGFQGSEYKNAGERAEGSAGVNTAVFDPSNIRSVNAAFDPSKSKSANLLASAAPVAVGLSALGGGEEAEAGAAGRIIDLMQPLGKSRMIGDEKLVMDSPDLKIFQADPDYTPKGMGKSYRYVSYADGQPTGVLQFMTKGPRSKEAVIQNVNTSEEFRRQGVASGLLDRARQDFNVKHSDDLTDAGRAWKTAVPSAVGATGLGALYTPEQNAALASPYIGAQESLRYGGRPDTIQAEEFPRLERAADFMRKYDQTPIGPMFEGTQQYLRNFGRERPMYQKAADYIGLGLDFM